MRSHKGFVKTNQWMTCKNPLLWILRNFQEHLFYRALDDCFWKFSGPTMKKDINFQYLNNVLQRFLWWKICNFCFTWNNVSYAQKIINYTVERITLLLALFCSLIWKSVVKMKKWSPSCRKSTFRIEYSFWKNSEN